MVPLRFERMMSWIERCPACDLYWFDRADLENAKRSSALLARQEAVKSLSGDERKELAGAIVRMEADMSGEKPISQLHRTMAMVGFPVVTGIERTRGPRLTVALALVMIGVFAIDRLWGGDLFQAYGYKSDDPSILSAVTACFVHRGWIHLIGNVYFLLVFGDAVEQKLSRLVYAGGFVVIGAFTAMVDGVFVDGPALIGGASGGVSVLIGMAVMLQRLAKVTVGFYGFVFTVPMLGYLGIDLAYQTTMFFFGSSGVAWVSHIVGLIMGAMLGQLVAILATRA
jgi:membrane associated rhomboid family serine protease